MATDQAAQRPVSITILADTLTVGGAEQLLLELLRGLDRERFPVRLCLLSDAPGMIGEEIMGMGIACTRAVAPARFDLRAVPRLRRIFLDQKPDILLLINHRNCLFYGIPAARMANVPCIINWQNETGRPYSLHRLTMACRRALLSRVDTVVAAARGHANYIAETEGVAKKKIEVIYNGVDPGRFRPELSHAQARQLLGIPAESPIAGIVAALRPDKAHEIFLQAALLVRGRMPDARFLIVGDGPRRDALERCAHELGIAEALHFMGFRRDMPEVLRAMDVCCLSSRPWQETFSVAALEAMASGLPVVCTRVGFMHEMVIEGETGLLVPVDEPGALADAISTVLLNPEQRVAMGLNARALVEKSFSLQHMVACFEDLFMRAAGPQGRHLCAE
jgi:glycosyltransferase involved in cell wall biosynthesis